MSTNNNQTIILLNTISSYIESKGKYKSIESSEIYEYAVKNKISLLYMDSLKKKNNLNKLRAEYEKEHNNYMQFLKSIAKISKILNNAKIDYLVFKTLKPYKAVPGDIDIVILNDDTLYERAVQILLKAEYVPQLSDLINVKKLTSEKDYKKAAKILTKPTYGSKKHGLKHISPSGTDFIDPEFNMDIDLQKEIALSYIVYLDKNNFTNKINVTEILNKTKTHVPTPELNLTIVIAHSLSEQMFLLGEFYSFQYILSNMDKNNMLNFIEIIKENRLENAAKLFITICAVIYIELNGEIPDKLDFLISKLGYDKSEAERIIKTGFRFPYKYGLFGLTKVFFEKMTEKRFRESVGVQILKSLNPKMMSLVVRSLIDMRRREYYLKEVEKE